MKLKEQTKRVLDGLEPKALVQVYDLVMELRRAAAPKQSGITGDDYLKVREALKPCRGSLTEDILMEREDRV